MNKKNYIEPEFKLIIANTEDILTASGGDPFNTMGDKKNNVFFRNTDWMIEV